LKGRSRLAVCLIIAGVVLILAAAAVFGYNVWSDRRAGEVSGEILSQFPSEINDAIQEKISEKQGKTASEPETTPEPTEEPESQDEPEAAPEVTEEPQEIVIDGKTFIGRLDIPALGLTLPVMGQWSYPNLRIAPCRYSGSAAGGDLIIAAHNFASHFGTLKYLSPGDSVYFTDADGNVYTYRVAELEVLQPTDIDAMENGGWPLTLFTCTIGGKSRVTVRCELAD
jgi:sortase A